MECETVRNLQDELQEALNRKLEVLYESQKLQKDRDEAIRERDELRSKVVELESDRKHLDELVTTYRNVNKAALDERDSLREEIARRDADDPMDTEDRINMETGIIRGIIGDHDKRINDLDGIVTKLIDRVGAALLRLDEIKRTDEANIKTFNERISAITTSVSTRLDGPTGVEKKILVLEGIVSEHERNINFRIDNISVAIHSHGARLAKLEARVSKKRVKK